MRAWTALLLVLFSTAGYATEAVNSDLREPIFNAAQAALGLANDNRANVLAPNNYKRGGDLYTRAEEIFKEGGKLERIQTLLAQATEHFTAAAQFAASNQETLQAAYAAREDAIKAGAPDYAQDVWEGAELDFFEAATRLEAGRERGLERYSTRSEARYREAELAAIEFSLLTQAERRITAAREADADDEAPTAYNQAVALLAEARTALAQDRYDTDRPRDLATQALHHAKHAEYIANLWSAIDDGDRSFEETLALFEREIEGLALLLDEAVYFDDGPAQASDQVRQAVSAVLFERGQLRNQITEIERHNGVLQQEVEQLQSELGGQSRARDRLQSELARQQRLKDRVQRLESMFTAEEAVVLRSQDRLVLRLIGMNFRSGQSGIGEENSALLRKLIEALALFPETPIIIEGHTDAYGADLTNLDLSNRRAESLAQFLLDNSPMSPALLTSVGFGETKPIANNETEEGRGKNRRIDVVLYPDW